MVSFFLALRFLVQLIWLSAYTLGLCNLFSLGLLVAGHSFLSVPSGTSWWLSAGLGLLCLSFFTVSSLTVRSRWRFRCADCFGFGLLGSCVMLCAGAAIEHLFLGGFIVRTRCPSICEFRLGFSFPSGLFVCRACFGRCHSLLISLYVTVVLFFCACVVSLSREDGCHALVLGFFTGVFLPSLSPWSVWSWCGCVFSESWAFILAVFGPLPSLFLGFCGFWSDLLFLLFSSCVQIFCRPLRFFL